MDTKRLEQFIFSRMADTRLPGLSIALLEEGKVRYARGFGFRDLTQGLPATPETLYGIGSVTKSITALAILQLAEEGKLELNDPVADYLPLELKPFGEEIRIWHLLTHTSGLPALAYSEALISHAHHTGGRWLPIAGPEDVLTFMAGASDWAETRPGEHWHYFNEGYALLGLIVQNLAGAPYAEVVRERILAPLGMSRSFFAPDDYQQDADVAIPYVLPAEGAPEPGRYLHRAIRSEGGLISSVLDLCEYLRFFLEGGRGVLAPSWLTEMLEPRIPTPPQNPKSGEPLAHYGYGLAIKPDFFGGRLVGHGGSVLVSTAQLSFLPERELGVAVLANGSGYSLGNIAEVALALALGEEPEELPFLQQETLLDGLTGAYETFYGTMTARVSKHADFLKLELPDRAQPQEVVLIPERLEPPDYYFYTLANGARVNISFHEREDGLELMYERYKFRRIGLI